ncbi:protein HflC [Glycocaulis albus]|jgi:membrane protease subunit HflC|uniref:Protein HflC n=1 Tax=Glycocaulis albus TaxID=1382801 RepID=A0ABQ1XSK6_9PROT|nr:protease modulator HflC [Glycocaulis albus]MBV5259451.1 protease modulator HflC [Synechococcus moorigangaii CMS01]GGH02039.1 protein HflC [Glycocaulis albus]
MPRFVLISLAVILAIAVIVGLSATFTVSERESALVLRLGNPVAVINEPGDEEPGLHFKIPFVDDVLHFDKRNIEFNMAPAEILAADQERLVVDAFLRYRIVNPLRVYQTVRDERGLQQRLSAIMDDSLRGVIASIPSSEVISGQRAEVMNRIRLAAEAQVATQDIGIQVIDVRILRADLPQQITDRVFERMRSERQQEAALIRAQGEERARQIRAEADREAVVILANARAEAERIRGEGDGRRTAIFAEAYGQDPDFFAFYRSMLAYDQALRDNTPIVISPDSEFFRYFQNQAGSPD